MNVEDLKKVFSSKILEKNEILFKEGDPDGQGYIIESGKISLIKKI
jgi:CRP-like cAMP-binding protein